MKNYNFSDKAELAETITRNCYRQSFLRVTCSIETSFVNTCLFFNNLSKRGAIFVT